MANKIVVGPIDKGLRNDVEPFVVDNDNFPVLLNAYQWRSRVKRKRGTSLLTRLQRYFDSTLSSYNPGSPTQVLDGTGSGNLLTGFTTLQVNASIVPGSVIIDDLTNGNTYTDPAMDGILVGAPAGSGTINYATGAFTITGGAGNTVTAIFIYYPDLPVMGLEEFVRASNAFPGTIAFDTVYSYNILTTFPYTAYDVSFYKNPAISAALPGYVPKNNPTPTTWNGQDYQQFYTVNYEGALWATNGINIPFSITNIGMQYDFITAIVIIAPGPPAIVDITIPGNPLVIGDFVFLNEIVGMTGINFQTGYVTAVAGAVVTVELPNATVGGAYVSGGIAQYLTNRSDVTVDPIRFYDGDPTNGSATAPVLNGTHGWVNFSPPLSQADFSIADQPLDQYYLVGARMIYPYKDRLLFIGPVIQTSAVGSQVYLQDTIIYSQNGTPYYTASFTGDPLSLPTYFPILVPDFENATATAYWEDQTGFGGFISAGIDQPLCTVSSNRDVLILSFTTIETRVVYSGNDIVPFNFYIINSELGSASTFSAINMDKGIITLGERGFIITGQVEAQRIDLDIPDEVFELRNPNNGIERVTAQRDYINEWIYFTYPVNSVNYKFPTQTLQYNYRDNSWGIFRESYTHYGQFRKQTGFTWSTVGTVYPTWNQWNVPWNASQSTLLQPEVIAGNQQGFVLTRDDSTAEGNSLYIQNIVNSTVTSPDHSLSNGDFIIISGALGTVSAEINGKIFSVNAATQNTFILDPPISTGLTYIGLGVIKRMYVPFIQTKQFPAAWGMARKTRIGVQQYLLTKTDNSQIQLLIYLSQNANTPYNFGPILPSVNSTNDGNLYSTVLYTCPESTNLGLTPANTNLQMPTATQQAQIWHRINTSLIGDTVQVAFTMSEEQMRSLTPNSTAVTITGVTQANPAVLTATNNIAVGQLIQISGIVGMTELNFNAMNNNNYLVIARSGTTITIDVNSTAFGAYVSGGSAVVVAPINQFAEIELHGFILAVTASQLLA